jgi:hypothetical protein
MPFGRIETRDQIKRRGGCLVLPQRLAECERLTRRAPRFAPPTDPEVQLGSHRQQKGQ